MSVLRAPLGGEAVPAPCDLATMRRVHEELIRIAEGAARDAFDEFGPAALDQYVVRSAIVNAIISLADLPPAISAELVRHARARLRELIGS